MRLCTDTSSSSSRCAPGGIPTASGVDLNAMSSVGPYQLVRALGRGSTSTVFLGVHQDTGKTVAVKMVDKEFLRKPQSSLFRIEVEIALLRTMDHPYITKFIELVDTPTHTAIIQEFAPGGNLLHNLRGLGNGFPPDKAFRYFYQVVSGLEYCHKSRVAHRDIKLENILLDEAKQNIKLCDFGIADFIMDEDLMEGTCGSPHYAAPEVVRRDFYDGALVDVWSLGVMLYGMFAGKLPFVDENIPRLLQSIKEAQFEMPAHFDYQLRDLITKMLEVDTAKRIQLVDVKEHPWWLDNCARYGLDPSAVASAPLSPYEVGQLIEEVARARALAARANSNPNSRRGSASEDGKASALTSSPTTMSLILLILLFLFVLVMLKLGLLPAQFPGRSALSSMF